MAHVYQQVEPTSYERNLARLAIAVLRDAEVSDFDILHQYTHPEPQRDRAYETLYYREYAVLVSAVRIKVEMRRLLSH